MTIHLIKSFLYYARRGEVSFQLHSDFKAFPWSSYYSEHHYDVSFTYIFAGWLWFQVRWTHV